MGVLHCSSCSVLNAISINMSYQQIYFNIVDKSPENAAAIRERIVMAAKS